MKAIYIKPLVALILYAVPLSACVQGRFNISRTAGATSSSKAAKLLSSDCVDPNLDKLATSEKIMLCDGTITSGRMSDCAEDGKTNCITNINFPALNKHAVDGTKILFGTTIAGVAGKQRGVAICRNGKGITNAGGSTAAPWDGWRSATGTVSITNGSVNVSGVGTGFAGDHSAGDEILVAGETRRIASIASNTSMTVTTAFTTTAAGVTYTQRSPNNDITVDDFQNGASPWYTGSDGTNCHEGNFIDVTNSSSTLVPWTAQEPTWTKIFQDKLTGVYLTNQFINPNTWTRATERCLGLNGGTAGSGWRLPTQKELMQMYIDGIAKIDTSFGDITAYYWTSTTASNTADTAWRLRLQYGSTVSTNKGSSSSMSHICVRE